MGQSSAADTKSDDEPSAHKEKMPPSSGDLLAYKWTGICFAFGLFIGALDVLWVFSDGPGGGWSGLVAMVFFIPGSIAAIGILQALNFYRWIRYKETWQVRIKAMASLGVTMLIVPAVLLTVAWQLPFYAAFAWNRAPMERVAAEMLRDPTSWRGERWIGVWDIDQVLVEGKGVAFHIKGSGGDNTERIMWSPVPPPRDVFHSKPMGRNWYFQNDYW